MVWVEWLAEAAQKTGYPVVEVDGWRRRGHGEMKGVEGVVGHHTATSSKATGDYPSLAVVRDGHSSLKGPLAHLGLGRNGTVYVIAAGLCYHAGASSYAGFTSLNSTFLGIEAENDGSGDWTQPQLDCYPKLVAALLHKMGRGVGRYASHRTVATPAGRKIDPTDISDDWMRQQAQVFLNQLAGGSAAPVDRHLVKYGDTLWALSKRYHVTVGQLREWNNLATDTIVVGQLLWVTDPKPPPAPVPVPREPRLLRKGDTGDDVRELQRILRAWYGNVAVDGIFGPKTETAVKRVQKNTPPQPVLVADGIVGPLTRAKLGMR